jgi:hypothetical protein
MIRAHSWLMGMLLIAAVPARAVPTVYGATGLITVPNAAIGNATGILSWNGKIVTGGERVWTNAEFGLQNRFGANYYDAKWAPVPDTTTENFFVPGMAIGIRGLSSKNESRQYYFALSKKFTFPVANLTFGIAKNQDWTGGPKHIFYGLEVPIGSTGISVLADHEGGDGTTNVGIRSVLGKNFCVYDYLLDYSRKLGSDRTNIIGICYQDHF